MSAIIAGDYSDARPSNSELDSLGIRAVCRYAGGSLSKQLSASEAKTLSAGGIGIIANFESYGRGGSYAQGVADAREADAHFRACGATGHFVIYFSIDYDVTNPAAQDAYFSGINSVIGVGRTDCYGNTALIRHLRSAGLIRGGQSGWRSMSTGWTGGAGSPSEFAIEQIYPGFNSSIDRDLIYTSLANAGAWFVGTDVPAGNGTVVPVNPPQNTVIVAGVTVSRVQERLNAFGYHLVVDGIEGPLTLGAIKDFQGKHGLLDDGIVGPLTWGALSQAAPAPAPAPSKNPYVPLLVDGKFGPRSIEAVQWVLHVAQDAVFGPVTAKAFQAHLGVKADGVIGPVTIKALQARAGAAQDGIWGVQTTKALQTALNAGKF